MRYVPVTNSRPAVVDDEDYEKVSAYRWWLSNGYAISERQVSGHKSYVRMHRLVMNAPLDRLVDHRSYDTLDNRKTNLRLCSFSESVLHRRKLKPRTSRFKGVSWSSFHRKWRAEIKVGGKFQYLGLFDTEEKAHEIYSKHEQKLCGAFAA